MKLPRLKIADEITRRVTIIQALLDSHKQAIGYVAQTLYKVINAGGRIFIAGNGGSAAEASHFAAELVGRYKITRPSIDARCLSSDGATITAIANDFGYEQVFAHQLTGQFQDGDVAIFFSTSGDSPNVVAALKSLRPGSASILFGGRNGGAAKPLAKASIVIGSDETAIIQECHLIMIHIICDLVERKLQQEPDSRFQYKG